MSSIRIPVASAEEASDLAGYVHRYLSEITRAMDLDVSQLDPKARIDSCVIQSVHTDDVSIEIVYRIMFSASDTCRGIDYFGAQDRKLRGRRDGGFWSFSPPLNLEQRSTADELGKSSQGWMKNRIPESSLTRTGDHFASNGPCSLALM